MKVSQLVDRHPVVCHMADAGMWPSIAAHGLLSTTALLDLFEVDGAGRDAIESQRRAEIVRLRHPVHGSAVVRDNKPLIESRLAAILDGCTLGEFYRLLNRRVFLWATPQHLERLLVARAYRDRSHTVITIDTQKLVERHGDAVTLSRINSGATLFGSPPRRGPATFERIQDFASRTADGRRRREVVEVAVDYSIPDMCGVTLSVYEHHPDGSATEIWRP